MDSNHPCMAATDWKDVDWKAVHQKSRQKAFIIKANGAFLIIATFLLIIFGVALVGGRQLVWLAGVTAIVLALLTMPLLRNIRKDRLVIEGKIIQKRADVQREGRGSTSKIYIFDLDVRQALLITSQGETKKSSDDFSDGCAVLMPSALYQKHNESENITLVCLPNRTAFGTLQDFQ